MPAGWWDVWFNLVIELRDWWTICLVDWLQTLWHTYDGEDGSEASNDPTLLISIMLHVAGWFCWPLTGLALGTTKLISIPMYPAAVPFTSHPSVRTVSMNTLFLFWHHLTIGMSSNYETSNQLRHVVSQALTRANAELAKENEGRCSLDLHRCVPLSHRQFRGEHDVSTNFFGGTAATPFSDT